VASVIRPAIAALFVAIVGCSPSTGKGNGTTPTAGTGEGEGAGAPTSDTAEPGTAKTKSPAPDFSLPSLDGGRVKLSDYKGKVVIIDFWSTTCGPCLEEMPELVKIYNAKKAEGLEVLAIAVDPPETQANIPAKVKQTGMNFPILLDEETEVMDRYNPKGEMPFTAVIDRSGSIVLKRSSYQPGDKASMDALMNAIDTALADK
jgi:cytochrome c biogenesis protein CcmG, thiol:disulfide interchange protein DsbE